MLDLRDANREYEDADAHFRVIRNEIGPTLVNCFSERGAIGISPYPESAYLTQLAFRVLKRIGDHDDKFSARYLAEPFLARIRDWARYEIDRQISLISAKSKSADPLSLAYAIALASSVSTDEQKSPENKQIFGYALSLFFELQNDDGSWPASRPLFHYPDVGNAYCFEYEVLTQLLSSKTLSVDLLQYIPHLDRAALLLGQTFYDLSVEEPGKIIGWASGHHPQIAGPKSWSTASVYHFVHALDRLVAEAIRRAVFDELGALYTTPTGPRDADQGSFAKDFLDADLVLTDNRTLSLRETVANTFVLPIARGARNVADGRSLGKTPMSAIFFGPPGTSKTQLAKIIGGFLGWPVLLVDPSYLVSDGLDRIQAQANRLFGMLAASEQVIVLLDEFDEMGRDRTNNQELLSRFITTAMLPKLVLINSERKIVFLLATNYVSGFDAAFSRGGRFDMLVQVMPPNLKAKYKKWPILKKKVALITVTEKRKIAEAQIVDLTYSECEALVFKLDSSNTSSIVAKKIAVAHKSCTLEKPNETSPDPPSDVKSPPETNGGPKRSTWKQTCERERIFIRVDA